MGCDPIPCVDIAYLNPRLHLVMTPPRSRSGRIPSDKDLQDLLQRLRCPIPLHALRTLVLGHISSPQLAVSPLAALAQAWGGELPEFASADEAEEVMQVLVHGLWNRLSEHQSSRNPFRLLRFEVGPSRKALLDLARMRAQELRGFADGLFGTEDELLLPQKAHESVGALSELHAMFDGAAGLLADETRPATDPELKELLRNLQQMTIAADEHINKVLQSCKRARGQHLDAMATVMSRNFMGASGEGGASEVPGYDDEEPDIVESPLSQRVTRNGVTVRVEIYGEAHNRWILEIVDAENASHVWDEPFETDQQALDEALRALDEEPLEFLGRSAQQPLN